MVCPFPSRFWGSWRDPATLSWALCPEEQGHCPDNKQNDLEAKGLWLIPPVPSVSGSEYPQPPSHSLRQLRGSWSPGQLAAVDLL